MAEDRAGNFQEGQRVLAQQLGYRFWHSGIVESVSGDAPHTYIRVKFDDGSGAHHRPDQVKLMDWREGSQIQCEWPRLGNWQDVVIDELLAGGYRLKARFVDGQVRTINTHACRSE